MPAAQEHAQGRGNPSWVKSSQICSSGSSTVFIDQFSAWILLGFLAQAFFTMRFVVQWYRLGKGQAQRRAGRLLVLLAVRRQPAPDLLRSTARIRCSSPGRRSVS